MERFSVLHKGRNVTFHANLLLKVWVQVQGTDSSNVCVFHQSFFFFYKYIICIYIGSIDEV